MTERVKNYIAKIMALTLALLLTFTIAGCEKKYTGDDLIDALPKLPFDDLTADVVDDVLDIYAPNVEVNDARSYTLYAQGCGYVESPYLLEMAADLFSYRALNKEGFAIFIVYETGDLTVRLMPPGMYTPPEEELQDNLLNSLLSGTDVEITSDDPYGGFYDKETGVYDDGNMRLEGVTPEILDEIFGVAPADESEEG